MSFYEFVYIFQGVSSQGLDVMIKAIYTGHFKLTVNNISDVLIAAHFLQMSNILPSCNQFMKDSMSSENCLQYLKLAEVYMQDADLINHSEQCLLKNFKTVSEKQAFLDVSKDALCRYLSSDLIQCPEMEILSVCAFILVFYIRPFQVWLILVFPRCHPLH